MRIDGTQQLEDKKILVIVTGSIAAVKTPILISNLIKEGAQIKCVLTPSASKLVSPLSLSTLSRHRSYQDHDQWDPREAKPLHISLAEWADLIVVAPLSATSLSRWVTGLSEGLAASILLASEKPVIAAAAMNTAMWSNQAVKRNWEQLKEFSQVIPLAPSKGLLACDRIGDGRMASTELIQLAIESASITNQNYCSLKKDLKGLKILVTAGPTIEDIDSTRYITNRSSGKMGVLLGQAARFRGASIDLIHGPLKIKSGLSEGLNKFEVRSAQDMSTILARLHLSADVIVMAAAIADIKSKINPENIKVPKEILFESLQNRLEIVPDLLTELIQRKKDSQVFLGFTALCGSNEEITKLAMIKKTTKGCDLLMANPIDRLNQGFDSDSNGGFLLGPNNKIEEISRKSKLSLAHQLLDEVKSLLMTKSKK